MLNVFRYMISFAGTTTVTLAILSSDLRDPTWFHQIVPTEKVQNWLGIFGALLGGTLVELFGVLAFWFCIAFFVMITPTKKSSHRQGKMIFWSAIFLWALSALQNVFPLDGVSFSLILQHSSRFGYISFEGLSGIIGWNFASVMIGTVCFISLYKCLSLFLVKNDG